MIWTMVRKLGRASRGEGRSPLVSNLGAVLLVVGIFVAITMMQGHSFEEILADPGLVYRDLFSGPLATR